MIMHPDGIIIDFPTIIKARTDADGRRMVEVPASVEETDSEGDIILQKALLDSADSFVKNGHLDLDHISELGARMNIANPESYILGRPTAVKDIGNKHTAVVGEIMRSADGVHNPAKNRYDAFWDTLHSDPPVIWRASVYGFPKSGEVIDCSEEACESGAWRYLIKGIDWRSLAFTRNPVNDKIKGHAKIVSAKSFIQECIKGGLPTWGHADSLGPPPMPMVAESQTPAAAFSMAAPRNMNDALGQYHRHMSRDCEHCAGLNSTVSFRMHFQNCCGLDFDMAEIFAHALMYQILRDRRRQPTG